MALVLHKLQLEGVQIEPYVRIVQNSAEIVRATLRCRGGLLSLERLSAVGFDVTQDGSLEILVSAGISGDLLLGSLHLRSMLFRTPHGRLECRGIGPPGVQMSFDYVYQPLVRVPSVEAPPRYSRGWPARGSLTPTSIQRM